MFEITENPNEAEFQQAILELQKNNGYCPVKKGRNKDTRCICKSFWERQSEGLCSNKLYKKVLIS